MGTFLDTVYSGSRNFKNRSRDLGPVVLVVSMHTKFEGYSFNHSKDMEGSQNLNVGHVT